MGLFKKIFSDVADELKKSLEETKKEMRNSLEEMKQNAMAGFTDSTSNSRDDDEEDDEEPKILLGDFSDGVLTIREGITELDGESLEHYKRIRKIVFPASLENLDSYVIDEQHQLEELDFSKVTKLKTIPDDFISGENKISKFVIPNGVTEVGSGFLGDAKSGAEIFVPASVSKLGFISENSNNDMIVYLFAADIDISDVESCAKTLYVLPNYYAQYAKKLKDCYSESSLREMPDDKMDIYGKVSESIPTKKPVESIQHKQNCAPSVDEGHLENNSKLEPVPEPEIALEPEIVSEPKSEPETETKVEVEQKGEPIENGGLFSARLEAMIAAALQDGVLTDKERELLKRRVEKEGEDWDEVEMIIEARLAEMNPVVSAPSSETIENNNVSQEQAKAKEVPALKVDKPISKEYVKTEEDKYATSIDIPEGVTIIPDYCFDECSSLESITLPSTIKQIGYRAFGGCSALTSIDIPEGVTIIPHSCFSGCNSLVNVTLPSTIKQIEAFAFNECGSLTSIDIDFNKCLELKEIGEGAFLDCSLRSVDLSRCTSLETIGEGAFSGCRRLTNIVLPNSVTSIGARAFGKNERLSQIDLSSTNIKVLDDLFGTTTKRGYLAYGSARDMKNLKHISFPASIQEVPEKMCFKLEMLDSVDLSKCTQLKRICESAFACTPNLKEVLLPDSIEVMEKWAFAECGNIKHIDMPASLKEMGYGVFAGSEIESVDFSKVTRLSTIPDATFGQCNKLKDVILPSSLEEFGSEVFEGSKLKNLDFSKVSSLEVIPERFLSSNSIKTLTIPNGVKEIEDEAFYVRNLEKMFLPPSLEHIGTFGLYDMNLYCFAPLLDELEPLVEGLGTDMQLMLYVLPQHLNAYIKKRDAEGVSENNLSILPMPDEYLYYYDN